MLLGNHNIYSHVCRWNNNETQKLLHGGEGELKMRNYSERCRGKIQIQLLNKDHIHLYLSLPFNRKRSATSASAQIRITRLCTFNLIPDLKWQSNWSHGMTSALLGGVKSSSFAVTLLSQERLQLMRKWLMPWDTQQPVPPPKLRSAHPVGLEEVSLNKLLNTSWLIAVKQLELLEGLLFKSIILIQNTDLLPFSPLSVFSKGWVPPSSGQDKFWHVFTWKEDTGSAGGGKEKNREIEDLYVEPTLCFGDPV